MNRKRLLIAVAALVALMAILGFVLRSRRSGDTTYRTGKVEQGNIEQTVSATGQLSAVKTVQVGTQVSGLLAGIFADFNDRVTKGQLLARIDPTLQEQAVRDAQAQLERAQAQLRQAQQEYNRNAPLARDKFISASEFGTVQVNLSVAQAAVKSAQVTLDRARQNLSYTNIYAPISGVVVERNVDVGQTVAASLSAPTLFLIAQDLSQMQILASVDESDISSIKEGQPVKFTVQSYAGRTFTGNVQQVRLQSKTTDNVVSYTAVVTLANPDGKLLPGMTATVEFVTGAASNVLTVPNAALRFKPSADELEASGLPANAGIDTTRRQRGAGGAGGASTATGGGAQFGGGAAGGGAGAQGANRTRRAGAGVGGFGTIWTLASDKTLKPVRVRTGLADTQRTQVTPLGGATLQPGTDAVVGTTTTGAATATSTNPLTPTRQGGPGGRPGGP
ncbi:MAG TPA: efflux RND transporter periplasmic adaptor subunit [Gemmatimonadaceae bacterium]|nr:efflux RND transporter periplasmic adaptor subunit [Gemmatimonadaceae bacterium]